MFEIQHRVPNADDELHCTQAALVMALEALGHPVRLSMADADEITGFREGVETWPYRMLAWLGENGYRVRHVDALDPIAFMTAPEDELRRSGLDAETLEYVVSISDFAAESAAIRRCLDGGNVRFEARIPEVADLADRANDGWLPLLSLDAAVLAQRTADGFEGHVVVATHCGKDVITIQDPGPPARWDWSVPLSLVNKALRSPVDTSGTITYVRPSHVEG